MVNRITLTRLLWLKNYVKAAEIVLDTCSCFINVYGAEGRCDFLRVNCKSSNLVPEKWLLRGTQITPAGARQGEEGSSHPSTMKMCTCHFLETRDVIY